MFNQCKHSWNLKHLGELGGGESMGSWKGGGEGCLRELTFLSTVYLKQALNNLLSVGSSFLLLNTRTSLTLRKPKTLSYDFTR